MRVEAAGTPARSAGTGIGPSRIPKTVYELHATIQHLLGLDYEELTSRLNVRDLRLTDVHGNVIRDILA